MQSDAQDDSMNLSKAKQECDDMVRDITAVLASYFTGERYKAEQAKKYRIVAKMVIGGLNDKARH